MVDDTAFVMQLGSYAPVAVSRPLGAHRLNLLDQPSLVDRLDLRLVVNWPMSAVCACFRFLLN